MILSISRKLQLAGLLPLIALLISLTIGGYLLIQNFNLISHHVSYYEQRQLLLTEIYNQLGYGKGIHSFKNYILRKDSQYKENAERDLTRALNLIEDYKNLPELSSQEETTMSILKETTQQYLDYLSIAEQLIRQKKSTQIIDEAVRIDDTPALTSINTLYRTFYKNQTENIEYLQEFQKYLIISTLILIGCCLMISIFAHRWISQKVIRATSLLSTLARRVTKGDYFIHPQKALAQIQESEFREVGKDIIFLGSSLGKTLLILQQSNSDLEQFAFVAAHDLQEPVKKIAILTDLLQEEYQEHLDEEGRDFILKISSASQRMGQLNEALLSYARLNKEGHRKQFKNVDLNAVVSDCLSDLEYTIKKESASFERTHLPTVRGNEDLLRSLFLNLISNALKYSPPERKKHIQIFAEQQENDQWLISVKDNGLGFNEGDIATILKPFGRLDHGAQYQGNGIGLANCVKILTIHDSFFEISGEKGKGAQFSFSLKAAQSAPLEASL